MELESFMPNGNKCMEPLEFLDGSTLPRRIGASFPLEKFGEIYFASNRRPQNPSARTEQLFFRPPKESNSLVPSLSAGIKGPKEKEPNFPASECHPKKFGAIFGDANDEFFLWSNEGAIKGREDSQHRINESCFDAGAASDDSGTSFRRKYSDTSHSDKESQDEDWTNKKAKKPREKNVEERRNSFRKEEASNSKMPPWHIDVMEDMTADLDGSLSNLGADLGAGSYNMSEALLSLPSLTVFKQEASSPSHDNLLNINHSNMASHSDEVQDHASALHRLLQQNNHSNATTNNHSHGNQKRINCSVLNKHSDGSDKKNEDYRFQYVLAAATSIATKVTEETLTYLNQGQSYEIKLKKVGELSNFRGKILKSVIRICFHERRLQYMEKEQIFAWQASRPGERIVELDVPLSYGLFDIEQDPNMLNMLSFLWDPTKEVGAYIKVNCISTEFTPKKHGGEKGVPFRIQVETFIEGETNRLHAAACQIKVFKLKGADRKHKQDREKILKRPLSEQDKYQPSYECTVLNDLLPEAVFPAPVCLSSPTSTVGPRENPNYGTIDPSDSSLVCHGQLRSQVNSPGKPDGSINIEANMEECRSPGPLTPAEAPIACRSLSPEFSCHQTCQWLRRNSFGHHVSTFANFTGADILRLTREDLIQICGLPDGIRLLYAIQSKAIVRLILYVCIPSSSIYHAIYLNQIGRGELCRKLAALLGVHCSQIHEVFIQGPNEIKVLLTDEVIRHIKDESLFSIDVLKDESRGRFALLLKPSAPAPS